MYFNDPNNNPNPNGQPAAPQSGEYHFTRDTAPSGGGYNAGNMPNSGAYNQNSGSYSQNQQGQYYNPDFTGGPDLNQNGRKKRFQRTKAPKPPRQKKGVGLGAVVAVALICSLLGGVVGAGSLYAVSGGRLGGFGHAVISTSDRTGGTTVTATQVKAGEQMSPAQIYSSYGSAVVSVSVKTRQGEGAGTGFIIDGNEGYILTCYHVIDGASAISVTLTDSTSYEATYVGGDNEQDVAILKIVKEDDKPLGLNSMVLGDSSLLVVGDDVCAIGNALGTLANTLTSGSVSALDRAISMSDGTVMNLLQTDTTINSGNSGGPLFNQYGEVIGIVNAKYSSSAYDNSTAGIEGIGFAIPINDVTAIMDDLMEHGYITGKPYLGISVSTVTAVTAQQYSNMVVGAYVNGINEGSCAETAGLETGDIITQVDGTDITTSAELIDAKNAHKAGEQMTLMVFRDGEYITLIVTLDEEQPKDGPIDDGTGSTDSDSNNGSSDYDYGYSYGNGNGNGGFGNGFGNGFGYGFWPFGNW